VNNSYGLGLDAQQRIGARGAAHRSFATVRRAGAWILWLPSLAIMRIAPCGFAATDLGDSVQGPASTVDEKTVLFERLERVRRNAIAETRPASAIEAEMQRARLYAWGCSSVTDRIASAGCRAVSQVLVSTTRGVFRKCDKPILKNL
jgi:hypothetical protein